MTEPQSRCIRPRSEDRHSDERGLPAFKRFHLIPAASVTAAVQGVDPDARVDVDLAAGTVRIEGERVSPDAAAAAIREEGYEVRVVES